MSNPVRLLMWILLAVLASSGCVAPARTDGVQTPAQLIPSASTSEALPSAPVRSQVEPVDTAAILIRESALQKGFSPQEAEYYHNLVHDADPQFKGFLTRLVHAELNGSATESEADTEPVEALSSDHPTADPGAVQTGAVQTGAVQTGAVKTGTVKTGAAETGDARPAGATANSVTGRPSSQRAKPSRARVEDQLSPDHGTTEALHSTPDNTSSRRTKPSGSSSQASPAVELPTAGDPREEVEKSTDSPPQQESPSADVRGSWSKQLREAIAQLQSDLKDGQFDDENRVRLQARLSLLCLAAEDLEKSMQVLDGLDDQQLEFWRQTMMGLGVLLASDELPKFRHRVDNASEHLSRGVSSLATLGPLRLANLTFCTRVNGFGDVVECDPYSLKPGAPVLLYVEVENFTDEEVDRNAASDRHSRGTSRRTAESERRDLVYETELLGRYEILDADQRQVVSRTLPVSRDKCRNHRRDYFIPYTLYMPEQISPPDRTRWS